MPSGASVWTRITSLPRGSITFTAAHLCWPEGKNNDTVPENASKLRAEHYADRGIAFRVLVALAHVRPPAFGVNSGSTATGVQATNTATTTGSTAAVGTLVVNGGETYPLRASMTISSAG